MAYLSLVEYDEGGTIRSLDGFTLNGFTVNGLGVTHYDDGGRFRTLVGMGQDPSLDIPIDLPLTPPSTDIPLMYEPPTPSPTFDTTSAPITGTLVDYTPQATPGAPQIINLVAPQSATPGVLTSIFSGVRNIFSSGAATVRPPTAGTVFPVTSAPTTPWTSQHSVISGVPNWGILAIAGIGGLALVAGMSGGGSRRRNPARRSRRNPAELILMGANPRRRR